MSTITFRNLIGASLHIKNSNSDLNMLTLLDIFCRNKHQLVYTETANLATSPNPESCNNISGQVRSAYSIACTKTLKIY